MIEIPVGHDETVFIRPQEREIVVPPWAKTLEKLLSNHHPETLSHSQRVSYAAKRMGEKIDFSDEEIQQLAIGGLLHDIGKTSIPLSVLNKASSLTAEERDTMEYHPQAGFTLIKPHDVVVALISLYHHTNQANSYPSLPELENPRIALMAEIVSCADKTDALLSARAYKDPWEAEEARTALNSGFYDPKLVNLAIEVHTSFNQILA